MTVLGWGEIDAIVEDPATVRWGDGPALVETMAAMREIIERIMTQHWDLKACECWVCVAGNAAGCRPRDRYLSHREESPREHVTVPWPPGKRVTK